MKCFTYKDLPVIEGEQIYLRPITYEDTGDIVRWRNDPEVQRWFLFRNPFTPELHESWLKNKVETGKVIQYIIVHRESKKSVGSVYFRDIDTANESAEYGIFIGEASARHRGIGADTAKIFTDFGFSILGLHRIFLKVLSDNKAAQRSYEKAGFVTEGTFRHYIKINDSFADVVFMAKLNEKGEL